MSLRVLIAFLACTCGCDSSSKSSLPSVPADGASQSVTPPTQSISHQQPVRSPSTIIESKVREPSLDAPVVFTLSDAAVPKVQKALATIRGGTHLAVTVDVDDEKYCTGFHYNLAIEANPSEEQFVLLQSQGIGIAIDKGDVPFLNGTELDYATLSSGESGFVFRNPNENVSTPDELSKGK